MDVKVYRLRGISHERLRKLPEAVADFKTAAERGDTWSQNRLANAYYQGDLGLKSDRVQALRWQRMAAELSDPTAQAYVGDMYYYGEGVKRDYAEAAKWVRAAAEQENTAGQNTLAIMLWYGHGVAKDEDQAIRLWRMAAKKGDPSARKNLEHLLSTWQRAQLRLLDVRDWAVSLLRGVLRRIVD
jgi:hypothetical protein